jgi:hypothetical protein
MEKPRNIQTTQQVVNSVYKQWGGEIPNEIIEDMISLCYKNGDIPIDEIIDGVPAFDILERISKYFEGIEKFKSTSSQYSIVALLLPVTRDDDGNLESIHLIYMNRINLWKIHYNKLGDSTKIIAKAETTV